jgi:hypothetical protein
LATVVTGVLGVLAVSATRSDDNVDYWLKAAKSASKPAGTGGAGANTTTTAPGKPSTTGPASAPGSGQPTRDDALPGALELSDGRTLGGFVYTTRGKDWEIFTDADKMIHRIPFIAVLSVTAVVVEQQQELEWRWKEMGTTEKIYTGRSFPTRRLNWTFKVIDGTTLTGTIKGQPLWLESPSGNVGPLVLSERTKGEMGQKLPDLVYVKRVIVSRRVMEQLAATASNQ